MGCDIHLYAEQRQADGSWTYLEPEKVEHVIDHKDGREPYRYTTQEWYGGRNYRLFAMLADVRNGFGFAGVDTGDRVEPLAAPRGVPDDLCSEIGEIVKDWDADGHSHTHFTLRELVTAPWDTNMITSRGVVAPGEFLEYVEKGRPSSWSGGISGPSVHHISPMEMAEKIRSGEIDPSQPRFGGGAEPSYFTQVQWTQTWRESLSWTDPETGEATSEWFECLNKLSKHTVDDGSDIRLVMFFDN